MKFFPAAEPVKSGADGDHVVSGGQSDDELDIRAILSTLWRRKWYVIICACFAGAIAALIASQFKPTYTASAKLLFGQDKRNVVDIQEVIVRGDLAREGLQNQVEILLSTELLGRVSDKLRLERVPEFNPALDNGPPGLMDQVKSYLTVPPAAREMLIDFGVLSSPDVSEPDPDEIARRLRLSIIGSLRSGLKISPVSNSRVLRVSFTAGNARLAARVVNAVAEQYILGQLEAELEATRSATEWLSLRVQELQDRVVRDEEAVERMRSELTLDAGQGSEITRQQLNALNLTLAELRASVSALEASHNRVSDAIRNNRDFGSVTEFRQSLIIRDLRAQENELLEQEVSLRSSVRDDHPALARLADRLEQVRQNIRNEAMRVSDALANDLSAARAREEGLVADLKRLEGKALTQSRNELQLRQLEREAQASRLLYENFLARQKETAEQQGLQTPDARVLSPAEPPNYADAARRLTLVLVSTILGAGAGIGLVFLVESLNNTWRNPAELEGVTGKVILATIPRIGARMHRKQVLAYHMSKPNSSLAESFRNLRTSILFSNFDEPPKVVMFTSSIPREGKSTASALVALTSSQMGKSTILVDCDLRLPSLSKLLSVPDTVPGLIPLLEGRVGLEEAMYVDEKTGLHALTVRSDDLNPSANAADILSSNRFRVLIEDLRSKYDMVILDTPPSLVVTDARIVSSVSDTVVYAVRWDSTPRGAVQQGLHEMNSVKAPVAGLVMTFLNEAKASKYTYDGYQYYKGRYKDYYVS